MADYTLTTGADTLAGNGGGDSFRYQAPAESGSANMDHILDFTAGSEKISRRERRRPAASGR